MRGSRRTGDVADVNALAFVTRRELDVPCAVSLLGDDCLFHSSTTTGAAPGAAPAAAATTATAASCATASLLLDRAATLVQVMLPLSSCTAAAAAAAAATASFFCRRLLLLGGGHLACRTRGLCLARTRRLLGTLGGSLLLRRRLLLRIGLLLGTDQLVERLVKVLPSIMCTSK